MAFTFADRSKGGKIGGALARAAAEPMRARIRELAAEGKSLAEISRKVGRSRERVRQILRSEEASG